MPKRLTVEEERLLEDKFKAQSALYETGGAFERALANLIIWADLENTRRIKRAFPEIWNKAVADYYHLSQSRM